MKLSKLFSLLLLLLLIGCSDTYQLVKHETSDASLSRGATAYILLPGDGHYESIIYPGSGVIVAREIKNAFQPYLKEIRVAPQLTGFDIGIASARAEGFDYVIQPEISHWEDRNTLWSSIPDKASIKLSIIDVNSGLIIDSAELGGTSKIMTFTNDPPEVLLPKPLADYAESLFK